MPFKKGESGNPHGRRPKSAMERGVEMEAKRLTPKALSALVRNLECGTPAAEVAAAKEILDRAWGKAKQTVESTSTIVHESRIAAIREELEKASEAVRIQ